ncbi:MAG: ABC transporter substrate-binding protein [Candidatus Delongbacteria bacterium]|nr:ABC transporter substrate-binding protein [Candidatus Delongbacteria bacterium]
MIGQRIGLIIFSFYILTGCSKKKITGNEEFRIFALSPSLVETVFFLGKGKNITGASSYCSYPEEALKIPVVANISDLNIEYTMKNKPDIVLLMPSQTDIKIKLTGLGIRSEVVSQESLEDILNSFKEIGDLIGASERSDTVSDSLRTELEGSRSENSGRRILISVGREYGTEATYIYSTGRTGFLNDIVELLGYSNALDTAIPYPKIGAEAIMTLDPDMILDLVSSGVNLTEPELLADWELYDSSSAWKKGNIIVIKGDHTTIPGPRIFDLIKELKEKGL